MCDFCENIKECETISGEGYSFFGLLHDSETNKYYITVDDWWRDYCKELEVAYCPMCGRKLSEETEIKTTNPNKINEKLAEAVYKTLEYKTEIPSNELADMLITLREILDKKKGD